MNIEELLRNEHTDERIIEDSICIIENDIYKVNNLIAIPIEEIAAHFDVTVDVQIIDSEGNELGTLCFIRDVGDVQEFTDHQLIAYLLDCKEQEYRAGIAKITKPYLVLHADKYAVYNDSFMSSAPIWGHFSHEINTNFSHKVAVSTLTATEVKLPTIYHQESILRAIQQPYGFERFLKTYHLLELLFDHDYISELRALPEDLRGFNKVLKEYSVNKEIEKLRKVIFKRQANINLSVLATLLNQVKRYDSTAKEIFFEYGSDANPIKKDDHKSAMERFEELLTEPEPFNFDTVRRVRLSSNEEKYNKFLIDITTYWIYRVRCSIAHNKIGEYLMKYEDESFVVEFIEPILKHLISESFKDETH